MSQTDGYTDEYAQARQRSEAKYRFFVHLGVFVAVMALLVFIDLATSPKTTWFIWPLIGWGFAVALHGARTFLLPDRTAIIDALTEQEMGGGGSYGGHRDQL